MTSTIIAILTQNAACSCGKYRRKVRLVQATAEPCLRESPVLSRQMVGCLDNVRTAMLSATELELFAQSQPEVRCSLAVTILTIKRPFKVQTGACQYNTILATALVQSLSQTLTDVQAV